ncbi:MAG: LytTR family transcriptional regulator [Gemmataceae bacterium]|nr:LytTR family transcriptional regulator [Gemmataceae bacterium]
MQPDWGREALRLTAAGTLGASVTPILLALARRFPIDGPIRWRNLSLQAMGVACLAPSLILVSCFLAAWLLAGQLAPSQSEVAAQMFANALLLMFCLSLLLAAIQILPLIARESRGAGRDWRDHLTISERGRLTVIALADVEWIETQGNYQALHTGKRIHLLRETSARLSAELDPSRFVRIHRRYIVAVDKVRQVESLSNGDAVVRLVSGIELRQSRQHRAALRAHLQLVNSSP